MGSTRKDGWSEKKGISEDDLEPITLEQHKSNLKKLIYDLMQDSDKDINEILDMPFHFFLEVIEEKNKPKQVKSLIAAFGG